MKKDKKEVKKPFFANLLDKQIIDKSNLKGGTSSKWEKDANECMKWPSDRDDSDPQL